jgi:Ca2+-dependent lipid-binding protein
MCDAQSTDMQPCAAGAGAGSSGTGSALVERVFQAMQDMQFVNDDTEADRTLKLGRLQFSIWYDFARTTLTLKILQAEQLAAKDKNGKSDPYVQVLLLPNKKHKLTTQVKRKTLNPRWNEVFAFEGYPYEKVINSTLCMRVIDHDRFSKDDIIGELIIPMTSFDLANGQTLWKNLQPSQGRTGSLGELCLSLCFDSTASSLTVTVIKARNLRAKDLNGLSDPYVKVWLIQNGRRIEKKKTSVRRKTLNPIFEETLAFRVTVGQVRATSLDVSVMDRDRISRNDVIGRIILGSKSGQTEVRHWNEMLTKPKQPVTQWHILRDLR